MQDALVATEGRKIMFEVPGKPGFKGRPRPYHQQGHTGLKNTDQTVRTENLIRAIFQLKFRDFTPIAGPVKLSFRAFFPIPQKTPKKKRAAMLAGDVPHTKAPDASNILKAIEDALNTVAYLDDRQISDYGESCKRYSDRPRLEIEIEELEVVE